MVKIKYEPDIILKKGTDMKMVLLSFIFRYLNIKLSVPLQSPLQSPPSNKKNKPTQTNHTQIVINENVVENKVFSWLIISAQQEDAKFITLNTVSELTRRGIRIKNKSSFKENKSNIKKELDDGELEFLYEDLKTLDFHGNPIWEGFSKEIYDKLVLFYQGQFQLYDADHNENCEEEEEEKEEKEEKEETAITTTTTTTSSTPTENEQQHLGVFEGDLGGVLSSSNLNIPFKKRLKPTVTTTSNNYKNNN